MQPSKRVIFQCIFLNFSQDYKLLALSDIYCILPPHPNPKPNPPVLLILHGNITTENCDELTKQYCSGHPKTDYPPAWVKAEWFSSGETQQLTENKDWEALKRLSPSSHRDLFNIQEEKKMQKDPELCKNGSLGVEEMEEGDGDFL